MQVIGKFYEHVSYINTLQFLLFFEQDYYFCHCRELELTPSPLNFFNEHQMMHFRAILVYLLQYKIIVGTQYFVTF